jgi:UDP-N-acetylglucosamine:LPS N-acetylglucosamine transferase
VETGLTGGHDVPWLALAVGCIGAGWSLEFCSDFTDAQVGAVDAWQRQGSRVSSLFFLV